MGADTDTRSNPNGPRFLSQRNLEKGVVLSATGVEPPRPAVKEGFIQLFSYYKPGLTAGNYAITAEQFIHAENSRWKDPPTPGVQTLRVCNRKSATTPWTDDTPPEPQIFEVMAPQFTLDPKLVNSFYPPEGHQDEGRILPHIVIEDPHFPWERDAGRSFDGSSPDKARLRDPDVNKKGDKIDKDGNLTTDPTKFVYRSIVPWIRILVFDVDDLKITKDEAKALGVPKYQVSDLTQAPEQAANGAFPMTAGEYLAIDPSNRVRFDEAYHDDPDGLKEIKTGIRSKETTQVIFPKKDMFYRLCNDIEENKYLAHVRNINTIGFPNAGVEEDGLYSIIISARTGSLQNPRPVTQIVHMISIEHHDTTLSLFPENWDDASNTHKNERIGLISLYSWTYTALPPDPVNFIDSMRAIVGDDKRVNAPGKMQMLRPLDGLINSLTSPSPDSTSQQISAKAALAQRFKKGYTLSRWRSETGEVTAAFNRGPLVPLITQNPPSSSWPYGSTTSKNYQIFDKTTGLMDLSYSHAWQLGKILAISDTYFSNALMRFRSFITNGSANEARSQVNDITPKIDILQEIVDTVNEIKTLSEGKTPPAKRVPSGKPVNTVSTSLDDAAISAAMDAAVHQQVGGAAHAGSEIYNEFNPVGESNTDWSAILKWITDKLYLGGIPAHILFPDPSFIPEESLRFFYIDDVWMDCLIDGALSSGNHLERDDDRVKTAIKQWYNTYLSTPVAIKTQSATTTVDASGTKNQIITKDQTMIPQIPCYGFILRSQIVKIMPDMKITVNWNNSKTDANGDTNGRISPDDPRAPVCQWLRPDDHTLVCLLDRMPEELHQKVDDVPDAAGIVLSQPAHQQRFSFGSSYDSKNNTFEFEIRQLYTSGARDAEWPILDPEPVNTAASCISPTTRVIHPAALAATLNSAIQKATGSDVSHPLETYIDYVPNSAQLALELNDPAYYFSIYPPSAGASTNTTPRLRQIRAPDIKGPVDTPPPSPSNAESKTLGPSVDPKQPPIPPGPDPIVHITVDTPARPNHIIVKDGPNVPDTSPPPDFQGAQLPIKCFRPLRVFADYKALAPEKNSDGFHPQDYVPTRNTYLIDLVFCVTKGGNDPRNDQKLSEILINIPTRPRPNETDEGGKSDALLSKDYDGTAYMLANQWFVPFLSRSDDYLAVRLVPRSADEHPVIEMNNDKTADLSFVLTDCDIPETKVTNFVSIQGEMETEELGFSRVELYERYQTSPEFVYSISDFPQFACFVIKRDVADPGH